MSGFRESLRRFQMNWLAVADAAPAVRTSVAAFRFNADDTPRVWDGDIDAFWPLVQIDLPLVDFPRFANVATQDDQLAA